MVQNFLDAKIESALKIIFFVKVLFYRRLTIQRWMLNKFYHIWIHSYIWCVCVCMCARVRGMLPGLIADDTVLARLIQMTAHYVTLCLLVKAQHIYTHTRKHSVTLSVSKFLLPQAKQPEWLWSGCNSMTVQGQLSCEGLRSWAQQQGDAGLYPHSEFDLRVVCLFLLRAAGVFSCSLTFCLCREAHLGIIEPRLFFAAVRVPAVGSWSERWCSVHVGVVIPVFFYCLRARRVGESERHNNNGIKETSTVFCLTGKRIKSLMHKCIVARNAKALQSNQTKILPL